MTQKNLHYWLAALHLPQVGPRTFLRWMPEFPDIEALFQASDDELRAKGFSEKYRQVLQQVNWRQVENDLAWSRVKNHSIICLESEDYPALLKEISDPPLVLFVQGEKQALLEKQVAMVGSRHATPMGIKNAEYFGRLLAEAGFAVTSGLARGIDGAGHRGALTASGVTLAVCGTGLNHIYPPAHQPLANKIIQEGGAVISEFPLATQPVAENFPRRNRVISGMSLGVLVVEAALKSGTLITARHALEQGREVFAIPGPIHNPLSKGCHHLIRQGAKLVETIEDILEELGGSGKLPLIHQPPRLETGSFGLSSRERRLLEQIDYEITSIDMILLRSRLTAGEVSSILLTLELSGYIQSVPGGYIREIPDDAMRT